MSIRREIEVTRKGLDVLINVTYGTDLLPIELEVTDYRIPEGATAIAYSTGRDGKAKKIFCEISKNTISFTPEKGFFEEGANALQIRVVYDNKSLFSYKCKVNCHGSYSDDDAVEVETQPTLVEQLITEVGQLSEQIANVGNPTDEQVSSAVNAYLEENPVSGGLTNAEKETILTLFKNIEYTADMSASVNRLESLFNNAGVVSYTITNNLTNVINSNTDTSINEGTNYSAILSGEDGYILDEITVTVGGTDVTSTVYADGVINIVSVSGDIVITASGTLASVLEPVYELAEETAFDGATSIDTGYKLFDVDKDWTVVTEFSCSDGVVWAEDITAWSSDKETIGCMKTNGYYWSIFYSNSHIRDYAGTVSNVKYVVTRAKGSDNLTVYSVVDGEKKTSDLISETGSRKITTHYIGKTNNLTLGYCAPRNFYLTGTIHDLKVYERILEETEINEFLGV